MILSNREIRVLLVDDSEATNYIHRVLLKDIDTVKDIQLALNGEEALKIIDKGSRPNLILLDINMPVMDGIQFLESYSKLDEETKKGTVVIMLTTSLLESDRKKAFSYREVNDFMNKPLTEDSLQSILSRFF